jgi:hypothetical protein
MCWRYQSLERKTGVAILFLASEAAGEPDVEMCLAAIKW